MQTWPQLHEQHPFMRLVQRRLTHAGFPVPETGAFDAATLDALHRFQQFHGLAVHDALTGPTVIAIWKFSRAHPSP